MKTVIIIQARTGSSRLPGKILLPLAGRPLLERMVQRVLAASSDFELVVATTTDPADDAVLDLCRAIDVDCFRGHPFDLLDRHYKAVLCADADIVVKIPSDCPLIDPSVIDQVLGFYIGNSANYDFVSNLHPPTFPDGNDVEVMSFQVLETAWLDAGKSFEREHTTPFIWERPERFRLGNVAWDTGLDYSMSHRWTIDYEADYQFIKAVYDELWSAARPVFSINEILEMLTRRPDLAAINARYAGVNWYRHHLAELNTIQPGATRDIDARDQAEAFRAPNF
jgi:spore coat polysaccharide biosynthesis protein SpsF